MTDAEHEERMRTIAAETEEIKRQMMQFEFQHKKDIADAAIRSLESFFTEADGSFNQVGWFVI